MSALTVARWRTQPSGIVVLGTCETQEAIRAAGIHPNTHAWSGSYFYQAGWVLHRDGTASRLHPDEGPNARGRAAVLFTGPVRARTLRIAPPAGDDDHKSRTTSSDSARIPAPAAGVRGALVAAEQDPVLVAAAVVLCEAGHDATWTVRDTRDKFCETCLRKAQQLAAAGMLTAI